MLLERGDRNEGSKGECPDVQRILEEDLCYRDKSQVFLALDLLEYHYFIGTEFRGKGCEILLTTVQKKKTICTCGSDHGA